MSAQALLDELLEPCFRGGGPEAATVELYLGRLLALDRPQVYDYLYDRSPDILACLPTPSQQAQFVLSAWRLAPIEHWARWAAAMPEGSKKAEAGELGPALAPRASDLTGHLLRRSVELEPGALRSVIAHLAPLRPALRSLADGAEIDELAAAAKASVEAREWWLGGELAEGQAAMHALIRAVEEASPPAADPLRTVRAADLLRAPLKEPEAITAMLSLAEDLPDETYDELVESLPAPDREERPRLYAEVAVAKATLARRDPNVNGGFTMVRERLKEIKALRELGSDYWPQRLLAGIACLDLHPSGSQVEALSVYLGANPGDDALAALGRWTQLNDRKKLGAAISRIIRPRFDPTSWARVMSEGDYQEAPVVRTLVEKLAKDNKTTVDERRRMARIVGALQIRTQTARDGIADVIVDLLAKDRPKSDLRVALVLAAGLGPDHRCQGKLQRAFGDYARRHSHKYTPDEYRAIVQLGITIDHEHLSKKAKKGRLQIVEDAVKSGVKQLAGKLPGLG